MMKNKGVVKLVLEHSDLVPRNEGVHHFQMPTLWINSDNSSFLCISSYDQNVCNKKELAGYPEIKIWKFRLENTLPLIGGPYNNFGIIL